MLLTNEERKMSHERRNHGSQTGEVLVRVQNVSKKFCRSLKKSLWYGLKDMAAEALPFLPDGPCDELGRPALREDEFWATNDISFELRRGECLGLIGHNGAGKTTLLKLLNGLIKPDYGRVEMHGRVGALIALGAGFNPILSGRENVYVNASVLGLSRREIDEKIEEIIEFAEIGEFIDAPVQSYSSGMQVRLGFAVATALRPDILILDEVLAVGDSQFRTKSLMRVSSLLQDCAVLFVSHSESQVRRISTSCMLLNRGKSDMLGTADEAYERYRQLQAATEPAAENEALSSVQVSLVNLPTTKIAFLQSWSLVLKITATSPINLDLLVFGFKADGEFWSQSWEKVNVNAGEQAQEFLITFGETPLADGHYDLTLSIFSDQGRVLQYHTDSLCKLGLSGRKCYHIRSQIPLTFERL